MSNVVVRGDAVPHPLHRICIRVVFRSRCFQQFSEGTMGLFAEGGQVRQYLVRSPKPLDALAGAIMQLTSPSRLDS